MNYIKISTTSFDVDNLPFKTKSEFLKIYKTKFLAKELDKVWNELKKFIKVDKPNRERE